MTRRSGRRARWPVETVVEEYRRLSGDGHDVAEIAARLDMTADGVTRAVRRAGQATPTGPGGRLGAVERDWRHRAACRSGVDPDLFFPVGEDGPIVRAQESVAKRVCRACPVTASCLTWALESGQDEGVWGGMSAAERRAHHQRQRARTRQDTAQQGTGRQGTAGRGGAAG